MPTTDTRPEPSPEQKRNAVSELRRYTSGFSFSWAVGIVLSSLAEAQVDSKRLDIVEQMRLSVEFWVIAPDGTLECNVRDPDDEFVGTARTLREAIDAVTTVEIRSLRSRLESAERERDELRVRLEVSRTHGKMLTDVLGAATNQTAPGCGVEYDAFTCGEDGWLCHHCTAVHSPTQGGTNG